MWNIWAVILMFACWKQLNKIESPKPLDDDYTIWLSWWWSWSWSSNLLSKKLQICKLIRFMSKHHKTSVRMREACQHPSAISWRCSCRIPPANRRPGPEPIGSREGRELRVMKSIGSWLVGGFNDFFYFQPYLGKWSNFDYFFNWVETTN